MNIKTSDENPTYTIKKYKRAYRRKQFQNYASHDMVIVLIAVIGFLNIIGYAIGFLALIITIFLSIGLIAFILYNAFSDHDYVLPKYEEWANNEEEINTRNNRDKKSRIVSNNEGKKYFKTL